MRAPIKSKKIFFEQEDGKSYLSFFSKAYDPKRLDVFEGDSTEGKLLYSWNIGGFARSEWADQKRKLVTFSPSVTSIHVVLLNGPDTFSETFRVEALESRIYGI